MARRQDKPTSAVERRLAPGEVRFVVKERKTGRNTTYLVYDLARGSYPGAVPGFGVVQGQSTRSAAEALAKDLEAHFKDS